jgi:hypothetical protein
MKLFGSIFAVLFFAGLLDLIDFKVYVGPHVDGEKVFCIRGKDANGQR